MYVLGQNVMDNFNAERVSVSILRSLFASNLHISALNFTVRLFLQTVPVFTGALFAPASVFHAGYICCRMFTDNGIR